MHPERLSSKSAHQCLLWGNALGPSVFPCGLAQCYVLPAEGAKETRQEEEALSAGSGVLLPGSSRSTAASPSSNHSVASFARLDPD